MRAFSPAQPPARRPRFGGWLPSIPYTILIDYSRVYVERTGAINTLTPASVDGLVGTIVDTSGTYIFRAPTDAARGTLREVNGKRVIELTVGDYYVSADSAATWKWLNDGTNFSIAANWKPLSAGVQAIYPICGTYEGSSSQVGFALYPYNYDFTNDVYIDIGNAGGLGSFPVANGLLRGCAPGVSGGRWNQFIALLKPNNANARERLKTYSFGRVGTQNFGRSITSPSNSNPASTLYLGDMGNAALSAYKATYQIGPVYLYQGIWTESDVSAIESLLDFGSAGRLTVSIPMKRISNGTDAYEGFPLGINLANGEIAFFYRGSPTHTNSVGSISLAKSSDNGVTWTVYNDVITDTEDLTEPCGLQLPSGRILIAACKWIYGAADKDSNVYYSDDNGETFSYLSTITTPSGYGFAYVYGEWRIRPSDGKILAPVYMLNDTGSVTESWVWQSSDGGATWATLSKIADGLNETSIIHLGGTNWLAVARNTASDAALCYALSTDNCATWAPNVETGVPGVSPQLFYHGDTLYCAVGDRTEPGGIRLMVWTNNRLHGAGAEWLIYETASAITSGGVDCGYPAIISDGTTVHAAWYDILISSPGIQYQRMTLPDFGSVL